MSDIHLQGRITERCSEWHNPAPGGTE